MMKRFPFALPRRAFLLGVSVLPFAAASPGQAARIGTLTAFPPLDAERVRTLPTDQQATWLNYLQRSQTQRETDRDVLRRERTSLSLVPADPKEGHAGSMPLNKPSDWYASPEAREIAANIVSFQTPAGGWGKNQSRNAPRRAIGQAFVYGNTASFPVDRRNDTLSRTPWDYVGTIDNDATTTEIRFLAKVFAATGDAACRDAAIRGIEYLLQAQFPNGGWPQVWPLQGGYHDGMTLNDDAMISVVTLIGDVARNHDDFVFVSTELRELAAEAEQRGITALLNAQVRRYGEPSLWAQQYDALTLNPASARNFEPRSLCSSESASVLLFLMKQPAPSPEVRRAIEKGVGMLDQLKIEGWDFRQVSETEGRRLIEKPGNLIWSRYYDIETLKPVFGDRDRSISDSIDEVSLERRNGYSWFNTSPQKAIEAYAKWRIRGRNERL